MSLTTDPNDPRLGRGVDRSPVDQHETYLVLSEEDRARGFVRPVRRSYVHVGVAGPRHVLRDLTDEERARYGMHGYTKFEEYPRVDGDFTGVVGRYWTQAELDSVGKGCGTVTTMGLALAETYARQPDFYGATYCCGCRMHLRVGAGGEFVWAGTEDRVGT